MPKAVEIKHALDCANKVTKVGNTVAYTWYKDSRLHTGKVVKMTKGTYNNQVYIEIPYIGTGKGFYNWRTQKYERSILIRKPAKSVAVI